MLVTIVVCGRHGRLTVRGDTMGVERVVGEALPLRGVEVFVDEGRGRAWAGPGEEADMASGEDELASSLLPLRPSLRLRELETSPRIGWKGGSGVPSPATTTVE